MAGFQRQLPFTNSRVYHKSCVQWGLTHGKIEWSNLGCGINGSGNLKPGYLREALDSAEKAWEKTSDHALSKKSINTWLGLSATDAHYS